MYTSSTGTTTQTCINHIIRFAKGDVVLASKVLIAIRDGFDLPDHTKITLDSPVRNTIETLVSHVHGVYSPKSVQTDSLRGSLNYDFLETTEPEPPLLKRFARAVSSVLPGGGSTAEENIALLPRRERITSQPTANLSKSTKALLTEAIKGLNAQIGVATVMQKPDDMDEEQQDLLAYYNHAATQDFYNNTTSKEFSVTIWLFAAFLVSGLSNMSAIWFGEEYYEKEEGLSLAQALMLGLIGYCVSATVVIYFNHLRYLHLFTGRRSSFAEPVTAFEKFIAYPLLILVVALAAMVSPYLALLHIDSWLRWVSFPGAVLSPWGSNSKIFEDRIMRPALRLGYMVYYNYGYCGFGRSKIKATQLQERQEIVDMFDDALAIFPRLSNEERDDEFNKMSMIADSAVKKSATVIRKLEAIKRLVDDRPDKLPWLRTQGWWTRQAITTAIASPLWFFGYWGQVNYHTTGMNAVLGNPLKNDPGICRSVLGIECPEIAGQLVGGASWTINGLYGVAANEFAWGNSTNLIDEWPHKRFLTWERVIVGAIFIALTIPPAIAMVQQANDHKDPLNVPEITKINNYLMFLLGLYNLKDEFVTRLPWFKKSWKQGPGIATSNHVANRQLLFFQKDVMAMKRFTQDLDLDFASHLHQTIGIGRRPAATC